jgi:hypothetical protein
VPDGGRIKEEVPLFPPWFFSALPVHLGKRDLYAAFKTSIFKEISNYKQRSTCSKRSGKEKNQSAEKEHTVTTFCYNMERFVH